MMSLVVECNHYVLHSVILDDCLYKKVDRQNDSVFAHAVLNEQNKSLLIGQRLMFDVVVVVVVFLQLCVRNGSKKKTDSNNVETGHGVGHYWNY
jgi:hypothetical protein